jgi:hypothetical protein
MVERDPSAAEFPFVCPTPMWNASHGFPYAAQAPSGVSAAVEQILNEPSLENFSLTDMES